MLLYNILSLRFLAGISIDITSRTYMKSLFFGWEIIFVWSINRIHPNTYN